MVNHHPVSAAVGVPAGERDRSAGGSQDAGAALCRVVLAPVELTGTEFELLLMLAREPGRVFSRDDILNHLRGHEADLYTRAVDIVVSRLRRKLEPLPAIKTLRNSGYALALRPHGHG